MSVRLSLTVTAAAIVLLASGCGGTDNPSSAGTTAPTTPVPSTTVAAPPSSTAPTPTASTPATSPTAAPSTSADSTAPSATPSVSMDLSSKSLTGIVSPSGHIACLLTVDPVSARCDVEQAHWAKASLPGCKLAYGDSAEVAQKKADLTCHGDTVFGIPGAATLPYGQSARYRNIVCTSRTTGMTCTNAAGHGFTVSLEGYRLF